MIAENMLATRIPCTTGSCNTPVFVQVRDQNFFRFSPYLLTVKNTDQLANRRAKAPGTSKRDAFAVSLA